MPHEVIMPALGMAQDTGVIVAWRKALGDAVAIASLSSTSRPTRPRWRSKQGLGSLAQSAAGGADAHVDLALIDRSGTRLPECQPPMTRSGSSIVIVDRTEDVSVDTLHFCEDDLPPLAAARTAEPALQLL